MQKADAVRVVVKSGQTGSVAGRWYGDLPGSGKLAVPTFLGAAMPAHVDKNGRGFSRVLGRFTLRRTERQRAAPPVASPFRCEVCGREFAMRIALAGHSRSHKEPVSA